MVKKKSAPKHWGAILTFNAGRDKKSGNIIQFHRAVATTASTREGAKKIMRRELSQMKKGKRVTKTFAPNPARVKNKKNFVRSANVWVRKQ